LKSWQRFEPPPLTASEQAAVEAELAALMAE